MMKLMVKIKTNLKLYPLLRAARRLEGKMMPLLKVRKFNLIDRLLSKKARKMSDSNRQI